MTDGWRAGRRQATESEDLENTEIVYLHPPETVQVPNIAVQAAHTGSIDMVAP